MFTSDFFRDAESSIQMIAGRKEPTAGRVVMVLVIVFLAFLFMPMLLLLDLFAWIARGFRA